MTVLARFVDRWLRVPWALRALVPAIGFAVLWWSSSRVPGTEPVTRLGALLHNAMHVVAYACLGGSIWLAWSRRPRAARVPMRSLGAWLVAGLYGIVDEVHQSFVPGRDCSVADALSDAAGAALAVLLLRGATGEGPVRWSALASVAAMAAASVLFATFA